MTSHPVSRRRSPASLWLSSLMLLLGVICVTGPNEPARGEDAILPTLAQGMEKPTSNAMETEAVKARRQQLIQDSVAMPADQQLAALCQTGSLLFSRGDCLAVKACTGSRYTHVAAVVKADDDCWVYDSMNGIGVRKLKLSDYLDAQAPDQLTLSHPHRPFTADECREFQAALEQELGREYDVFHFVTGRQTDGIHCAEYITSVLMSIDWLQARNPGRVSPGSLLEGIDECGAYASGGEILISQPLQPLPEVANWHQALWQNTKLCCHGSCRQLSRWVLCR